MYTFLPQLLIILSLVGIVLIVLRRTPELRFPIPVHLKNAENFLGRWLRTGFQKFWHYILEVKELSKKTESLIPRHFPKLHLPKFASSRKDKPAETAIVSGEEALKSGDQVAAEEHYINAIKHDPTNEQAFAGLSKLYLAQNKTREAVETFKFLIKHNPENAQYSAGLGQAYYIGHKYDNAITAFERAVELEPDNPKHFIGLAMTLESKNHLEEAILNYRRAAELDREDTQTTLKLCEALVKKGDKAEAEQLLQNVLLIEPTNNLAREKLMQLKY